jgi:putative intracellular protease/amidase
METTDQPVDRRRRIGRFVRHYLEMVVAMLLGMYVLGAALRAGLGIAGVEYSMLRFPELVVLEMGCTMALGMAAWMRYRGHGWPATLEMSAAMLVPAVVAAVLVWLDALDGDAAMMPEHTVMFPLMLLVMLRRRDEYTAAHVRGERAPGRRRFVRTLGWVLAALLAFLLVPAGVYAAGASAYERSRYTQPEDTPASAAAIADARAPVHDSGKPTAVIVVGNHGANVADTLVPYEILATTGAFNVYTVAAERRLVPLLGGLDLVPDLSFAELDQRLGGAAPDVTVVPDMPRDESSDADVTGWLRDTASDGLVLGVCTGARLLAEAGLLDGRPATSHWFRLSRLEQEHPDVDWQRGVRYLDDGDVITTGGLLSSVDGTLRVVERLVDTGAAAAAAQAVGWRYYSAGTAATLPGSRLAPGDAILHLLNVGFRASETNVGVVLTEGVGEIELAAAFGPYGEVKAARTLAVTAGGDSVRSRHGLTFVPRASLEAADRVDRLLVPGAGPASGIAADIPVVYLHQQPGFAFDPALREVASTMDVPTARWTAKILEYPTGDLGLSGPDGPWTPALQPFLLGLLGLAAALATMRLVRRRGGQRMRE